MKRIVYSNIRKPFLRASLVILSCVFAFSFALIRDVEAAKLFLYPDPVEIAAGGTGIVEVRLDTEGESLNAAQAVITIPPSALAVKDVLTGGSVLPLSPESPFVGIDTVKIVGGAPSGYEGSGILARIILEAKENALVDGTQITFDDRSVVFLNDGKATPARLTTRPAGVQLFAASALKIVSATHPDETQWYAARAVSIAWDVKAGASYSYQISRDPFAAPDDIADEPIGDIQLATLEDGVYYFSLREINETTRNVNRKDTNKVSRLRVMVDGTQPEPFDVLVTKQPEVYGGDFWYAVFAPTDAFSGIEKIEIAEVRNLGEEPQWFEAVSPYALRFQDRGARILVRVTDKAGNAREVAIESEPEMLDWLPWSGLLLAGIAVALFIIKRRKR